MGAMATRRSRWRLDHDGSDGDDDGRRDEQCNNVPPRFDVSHTQMTAGCRGTRFLAFMVAFCANCEKSISIAVQSAGSMTSRSSNDT